MRAAKRFHMLRDLLVTAVIFGVAVLVCSLLAQVFDDNNPFAVSVFILAVALTACFTTGYFFGVLGAVLGVFFVNYLFTYPFGEFNLTISGYPLTFSVMMIVSVIISTLTTRVKQQEQLRFEVEKEKMRADLLRSVSHDLRTPLASILGASSALLDDPGLSPDDRQKLTREINKDAAWLHRVMENILSVTKLSGDVALKKETEVVEEIVGSAIVKFRKSPGALPVKVEKPEEILLVPMDATLMEQVLVNLFENSSAHGKGATHILVRVTRESDRVVFCVEDDGAGISGDILPRLFKGEISRPASSPVDMRGNMGIGLCVCQSILRAHGGGICAYNNRSGGAGIRFWLPCEEENDGCEPT